MKMLSVTVVAALLLAGCSSGGGKDPVDPTLKDPSQLEKGKGAIAGLLLDDRFRPIAGGQVLVQQTAQTTTSDANGEFYFIDLEPGTYRLRAEVLGHEPLPLNVEVNEGEYAEAKLIANRLIEQGSAVITQEYSMFIPCAYDVFATGGNLGCTLDEPDGYSSVVSAEFSKFGNVSAVVSEIKTNKEGRYEFQFRVDDGTDGGGDRFAVARFAGDYFKLVSRVGVLDEVNNGQNNNVPFRTDDPVDTIFFVDHIGREEAEMVQEPTGEYIFCCGVGVTMGVKATIVQSIFIDEPEVDLDTYQIYR